MSKRFEQSLCWILILFLGISATQAQDATYDTPHPDVEQSVIDTVRRTSSQASTEALVSRPIGIFDSGTGGLTVLERILTVDEFHNLNGAAGSDGTPDFATENFIFLADQANMPYGNYPVVGKHRVLDDLIVKDAKFLLGRSFHSSSTSTEQTNGKLPVKVLVIACNTATAYGQPDIERAIERAGADIDVIGVIDAGAQGALELFKDGQPGSIAVVQTMGTVLSGAYPSAIKTLAASQGIRQPIQVYQQGAYGLAGTVDGAAEFVDRSADSHSIRTDYRGPSLNSETAKIDPTLFPRYQFNFEDFGMLFEGTRANPTRLQLNSVENYIRYHLVTLLEDIRKSKNALPLRALIMGCTHFPYFADTFQSELNRLYYLEQNGRRVYRHVMAKDIVLIDPAVFTARELYRSLRDEHKLATERHYRTGDTRGEFYITIPCRSAKGVMTNAQGGFLYEYKYGRDAGMVKSDFLTVPLKTGLLTETGEHRLRTRVPGVWSVLERFRRENAKLQPTP